MADAEVRAELDPRPSPAPARTWPLTGRLGLRGSALDVPLALLALSLVAALGLAYDPGAAWPRFWRILGGLALCVVCSRLPEQVRWGQGRSFSPLRLALGVLPALIAAWYLLSGDWLQWMQKLSWLNPLRFWLAGWLPQLALSAPNPNTVGGVIAAYLPLQIAAVGRGSWRRLAVGLLLIGLAAIGLLMSASRGAWMALAVVVGGYGSLWLARRPHGALAIAAAGLIVGLLALAVTTGAGARVLAELDADRLTIWRNSLDLARDYPFTGLGLGGFSMAYSTYILLLHVGHTAHAHHLFLDIWLELGAAGLVAFVWLWGVALLRGGASPWRRAALAATAVVVLHGLADDAFLGYGGQLAWLLFIPAALAVRPVHMPEGERIGPAAAAPNVRMRVVTGNVAVLLALSLIGLPSVRAALEANLGALAQTRAELADYRWPDWPTQDALRRALPPAVLAGVIAHYQAALALDPTQATAHRRLGQMALSLGQYDSARDHLEAAHAAAPAQEATRRLLGEVYAIAGETDAAVRLWQMTGVTLQQLRLREWWYTQLGEAEHARALVQAAWALYRTAPPGTRL